MNVLFASIYFFYIMFMGYSPYILYLMLLVISRCTLYSWILEVYIKNDKCYRFSYSSSYQSIAIMFLFPLSLFSAWSTYINGRSSMDLLCYWDSSFSYLLNLIHLIYNIFNPQYCSTPSNMCNSYLYFILSFRCPFS